MFTKTEQMLTAALLLVAKYWRQTTVIGETNYGASTQQNTTQPSKGTTRPRDDRMSVKNITLTETGQAKRVFSKILFM